MHERAHATRLEGNTNENSTSSAVEIVPLILSGHIVKVWGELDTPKEEVVAHIVVGTAFWFFLAQVGLQGYLRIAGYVTVGVLVNNRRVSVTLHVQVGLIHVKGFIEVATERSDEDLIYFEFHDEVWKPPTLGALYAVALSTMSEP